MVADWRKSLHAQVSPEEALKKDPMSRRISAEEVPEDLAKTVVGCAECHMLNSEKHKDTFEHNGSPSISLLPARRIGSTAIPSR